MTAASLTLTGRYFAALSGDAYASHTTPDIVAGSTEIYLTERPDGVLIVTFRGSQGALDWLRDGRAYPWWSRWHACWVHRGFLACFEDVRAALLVELRRRSFPPVIFNGHSKGGAEATLMAAYFRRIGLPVLTLVTQGSPKVGWRGLASLLSDVEMHRYVHGADLVPRLPRLLYQHICPPTVVGQPGDPIRDHLITSYQAALAS